MRIYFNKWKTQILLMILAIGTAIPGVVSEAATMNRKVTDDKSIRYIGSEVELYNATNVKINNKPVSKYKKKIKTVKTETDLTAFNYQTQSYFKDADAYNQYEDYRNATYNARKYVANGDYTMRFLKAGTYTISYVTYSKERMKMEPNGNQYSLIDSDGKQSSELYERKQTNSGEQYYQGVSSGKIYTEAGYIDGSTDIVAASIRIGADKKQHVYCQPCNVIKTTHSRQYKVLKTRSVISSVQLGKTKLTHSNKQGSYSSSLSSQRAFLSGNSGKLTVKTADKNYSIMSIIVETYGKDGKPVYTKVSNKKKINYGLHKMVDSGLSYSHTSLYKNTRIYVSYKNKFTGEFCRIDSVEKNKYGSSIFFVTRRRAGEKQDTTYTTYKMPDDYTVSYTFYKK